MCSFEHTFYHQPGGGSLKMSVLVCAWQTSKSWPSLYLILVSFTTDQYTNFPQKHKILSKLTSFLAKYTQLWNFGTFVWDKNPPIDIPKFLKTSHDGYSFPLPLSSPPPPLPLKTNFSLLWEWDECKDQKKIAISLLVKTWEDKGGGGRTCHCFLLETAAAEHNEWLFKQVKGSQLGTFCP